MIFTTTVTVGGYNTTEFVRYVRDHDDDQRPPTVTVGGPITQVAGLPVVFTGGLAEPSTQTGRTFTYAWSVVDAADPSFTLPAAVVTNEPTFVFTPSEAGDYRSA